MVRVSLLGPAVDLARLESALKSYPDPEVRVAAGPAMNKAAGRLRMSGPDSMSKKYVNVLGGSRGPLFDELAAKLTSLGFTVSIVRSCLARCSSRPRGEPTANQRACHCQ